MSATTMRWRSGQLASASVVLAALSAPTAHAADDPAWLNWRTAAAEGQAPAPACGDAPSFEATLSRRLGEDAATAARRAGVNLTIDVGKASTNALEHAPLVATFSAADGRVIGRRALEPSGSTCAQALDALSIATALLLQDLGSPPAVSPPMVAAPLVPPPVATIVEAPRTSAPTVTLGARGGAVVRAGDVPLALWGLQASLEFRARTALVSRFFVAADVSPRQRASSDLGVDFSLRLITGRAGWCPFERRWSHRAVGLCAALGVGRVSVIGDGLSLSSNQDRWRVAADGGATLTQLVSGDWSLAAEVRLEVPFQRDRITVTDARGQSGDAFRAAPVGGAAVLSFGYSPEAPK